MAELAKYDSFIEFTDNGKGTPEEITAVEYQRTENGIMKITVRCGDKGMSFLIPVTMLEEEIAQNPELYEVSNDIFPLINSEWIMSLYQDADGTA
jgi:nitrogen fixation protein